MSVSTTIPTLNSTANPVLPNADLLSQLADIPWKKAARHQLLPLLEAVDHSGIATFLQSQIQPALHFKGQNKQSVWRRPALSLLATLNDPQSSLQAVLLDEEFPSLASAIDSARELLTQALELSNREKSSSKKKSEGSREFSQLLKLYLQEEQEIFSTDLQPLQTPLFLIRTFSLTFAFCLTCETLEPQQAIRCWLELYQRAQLIGQWIESPPSDAEPVLLSLLLRGELCSLLGLLFAEITKLPDLYTAGRKAFCQELDANTDNDGSPHHRLLTVLPDWLPAFVRLQLLAEAADRKFLSATAGKRWRELLERAASLTSSQGQLVLSNGSTTRWVENLSQAILLIPGWKKRGWAVQTLQALQGKSVSRKTSKKFKDCQDDSAATQTDWGHLACLRNNWYPGSDLLAVAYESPQMPLELTLLATPAFKGIWQTELRMQDNVIPLTESWSALCWYNHESCDYLELRLQAEGVTIDRQIFLSRTDHLALLADSVKAEQKGQKLELQWQLPLHRSWQKTKGASGRELILKQQQFSLRLLPLSLPQDTLIGPDGRLQLSEESLQLTLHGEQNLCQALLLDWSPERHRNPCDWTSLTITQERQMLSPRQAFAARARVGRHQWVFLRNLEHSGLPRAVLGLHSDAETVIAEFLSTGQTEKLVEVHYEEEQ